MSSQEDDRANRATPSPTATRDHLANERTLLAWSRTAIAIIGLGFVVARFGLLLRELGGQVSQSVPRGTSTVFGTALVASGAVLLILSLLRYLQASMAIERNDYRWSPALGIALVATLIVAAVLLAVYLIVTA
jgi:putative membrane protein